VVATALAALLMASPAHAAADTCHPRGSHTKARTGEVRVFGQAARLYGCRLDGGRPQLVTARRSWGPLDAAGSDVAVALGGCDNLGCATQLRVVRVRRRSATPLRTVYTDAADAHVSRVAIGGRATLAWTECEPDAFRDYLCGAGGDSVKSVWISSRRTPTPVRLDRARSVGARSVTLAHGRVRWRNGGKARSAPIP
jgi:hypothetical protein